MKKLYVFLASVGMILFAPFVCLKFYQWHVQPIFDVVNLNYVQMFMLRVFWQTFTGIPDYKKEESEGWIKITAYYLVYLLLLLVGWLFT